MAGLSKAISKAPLSTAMAQPLIGVRIFRMGPLVRTRADTRALARGLRLVAELGQVATVVMVAATACGTRMPIRHIRGPQRKMATSALMTQKRPVVQVHWRMPVTTGIQFSMCVSRQSINVRAERTRILSASVRLSRALMGWRSRPMAPAKRRKTNAQQGKFVRLMASAFPATDSAPRGRSVDLTAPARRTATATASLMSQAIRIHSLAAMIAARHRRVAALQSCAGRRGFSGASTATRVRTGTSPVAYATPCRSVQARSAMQWSMPVY